MKSWLILSIGLAALSTAAVMLVQANGWTLYYGDAEAHLAIARRVVDSRTPGYDQLGTVWLPLPHALMLPLVANDKLWSTGLAGAIPSAMCFAAAGLFLYGAVRRIFGSTASAAAAALCLATNPNLLYLQSTPMTEAPMLACLTALLYFAMRYAETRSVTMLAGAGLATLAATLTRYEGWILIPFGTLFILLQASRRRAALAAAFCLLASIGPLYWLAHNWWYFGNPLEFLNGPYSPRAIQGGKPYPGDHDLIKAVQYYAAAAGLCAGWGLVIVGAAGIAAAAVRRAWWPMLFLSLTPAFIVWSVHSSSGSPIYVPTLWPFSYYNSRYGLTALPLLAFGAGGLIAAIGRRGRAPVAAVLVLICLTPWLADPRPDSWICWKESEVNSNARRAFTHSTAAYLAGRYRPGTGIFSTLGDMSGVFREAGIPFREVLQDGNEPAWEAAAQRPDLFLHEEWAVAIEGGRIAQTVARLKRYRLVETIAPNIQIYQRN